MSFRGCSPDALSVPALPNGNAESRSAFHLTDPQWLQLSPYGEFPHSRGLQQIDRAAAEGMVAQFNSFRARLGRLFGGLPVYVGHPDLANANELADRKAYGWLTELEAREEGLFGRAKWSEAGCELLQNAHYKYLSPYWEAREVANRDGRKIYQPVALISVGLTNQPNIPVRPLANEVENPASESEEDRDIQPHRSRPNVSPVRIENRLRATMHTVSVTEGIGGRRNELLRLANRRDRIQERVRTKMQAGLTYDEAWENVKRECPGWFRD